MPPYILIVADSCNDFVGDFSCTSQKYEVRMDLAAEQFANIGTCTQRMGLSCVPIAYKMTSWIAGAFLGWIF